MKSVFRDSFVSTFYQHTSTHCPDMALRLGMLLLLSAAGASAAYQKCEKVSMCSCKVDDGNIIDLKPLSKDPPWKVSHGDYDYEWNPCDNFNRYVEDTKRNEDLASFQKSHNGEHSYMNGKNAASSTDTLIKDGLPAFLMTDGMIPYHRETVVECVCPQNSNGVTFEYERVDGSGPYTYIFKLTAPNCCPGYVPGSDDEGEGLSAGSIMCIIFFGVLLTYFIVGVVIQSAVRKAQGIERVPNVTFWSALPGLIKDGVLFTFTCGKGSSTSYGKL